MRRSVSNPGKAVLAPAVAVLAVGMVTAACGGAATSASGAGHSGTAHSASKRSASKQSANRKAGSGVADAMQAGGVNAAAGTGAAQSAPSNGSSSKGSSGKSGTAGGSAAASGTPSAARPLAGKIVGIDPGHNGRNRDDPSYINHLVWNGREWEACDTTGTETDSGFTEASFNFKVATYLKADLRKDGAKVVLTRKNNNGVGPCVNTRARILNRAHANVSIDIHADGGPTWGRGFTVLQPVSDKYNKKVVKSSITFGHDVRAAMLAHHMHESDYYGKDGLIFRDDLAGLNLTTEPKILIESANMQNSKDAYLLEQAWFQKRLAHAFTAAIVKFLAKH
jgi:N-acetylmuramoyl-L-alanine amidase